MEYRPNTSEDGARNLPDFMNVTISTTLPPQASSTVEKQSILGLGKVRCGAADFERRTKHSILNESDIKQRTVDSSLGILNISSLLGESEAMAENQYSYRNSSIKNKLDAERQLARELLQKCSESRESTVLSDQNKENDGNLQNLSGDCNPLTATDSRLQSFSNQVEILHNEDPQVVFKPNEISARSSVLDVSANKESGSSTFQSRRSGISFDTTAAAELLAQFGDEDFQSGSRVGSRMLADELSWNQNYSYAMPMSSLSTGEKEHLELSCFSGIIGDFDLSTESHTGRKFSVGEFFQRKCGNIGQLQETDSVHRPSFGVPIASPTKQGNLVPLVDETLISEGSCMIDTNTKVLECGNRTEHSLMSLSSIAQALNNIENGSPRRLVDELIMAKRKKKLAPSQLANAGINGISYLPQKESFHSSSFTINEKPERDTSTMGVTTTLLDSARYSLDNKIAQSPMHVKPESARMSLDAALEAATSSNRDWGTYAMDKLGDRVIKKSEMEGSARMTRTLNQSKTIKQSSGYHSNIADNLLSSLENSIVAHGGNMDVFNVEQNTDVLSKTFGGKLEFPHPKRSQDVRKIKQENVTMESLGPSLNLSAHQKEKPSDRLTVDGRCSDKTTYSIERDSKLKSSITVGQVHANRKIQSYRSIMSARNTNDLFSCIVRVSREAEIEILNGSDRWMTCTLALHQIQGDRDNISLDLPGDTILVEPDKGKFVKIGVKVHQMGKPIMAMINISVSDMVTRSSGVIEHVMCFVPEEPQISVMTQSGLDEIHFHTVAEKSCNTSSITLENKNNAELPIRLMIAKDSSGAETFNIDNDTDEVTDATDSGNEINYNLTLGPHQRFPVNIQFKGIPLATFHKQQGLYHATGTLVIQLRTDDGVGQLLKRIKLTGAIGVSRIDLVDTQLPIVITRKESKPINLVNSGDVAVMLSASLVENDHSTSSVTDFSLKPNTLMLQVNERGSILVTYKSREDDVSERQAHVKVVAGENEYYYPVIGESFHHADRLNVNEAQRCITPQSQQICSPTSPRSLASNRSANSGRHSPGSAASTSTVSGDTIPIQSTNVALVWGSIKSGRSDTKSFTIRNKIDNKIRLQVNIVDNNKSFKFLKDSQVVGTSMSLVLQRMGSKEISVIFSPNNLGACAGKIIFTHYNNAREQDDSSQRKTIYLFGYGGIGKVEILQAFKDTGGLMWLSLGHMNAGGKLSARIKLQNVGDLCSYAVVKLTPKALYPAMVSSWQISPTELLLGPGETQWVKLEFHPRREDLALLKRTDVSHVGTLTITHGDEPTRWRIRRLYGKLKDTGKFKGAENDTFKNIVFPLCKVFPGETLIEDFSLVRDPVQHLGDLCRGVSQHQVMLTMEVNADETMTMLNDNVDDTQIFYSVCSDSSSIFTAGCETYMPSETLVDVNEDVISKTEFTVTPTMVTLAPPFRTEATVIVSSLRNLAQPFETVLSHGDVLKVVPTEGMIPAGRSFPLKIQCRKFDNRNISAVLQIFMEQQKREVLISVSHHN